MIYILLPVFNEGSNLEILLKRIRSGMESRGYSYHIIAYNDGSTDNTSKILEKKIKALPLTVIGKPQNEGLGFSFLNLCKEVFKISKDEDDIAVVLDSDNTHNPEHIYHMVNKIRDGFDVVIGSRYLKDSRVVGVPWFRQLLSYIASLLMRSLYYINGVKDYTCGYRAYHIGFLRKAFNKYGNKLIEEKGFACMAELLIKLRRLNVLAVEVPLVLRYDLKIGESKMEIIKTIKNTLQMVFNLWCKRIVK